MSSGIDNSYDQANGLSTVDPPPQDGGENYGSIGKRLVVFCDGTGQAFDQDIEHNIPTNVARLAMALKPSSDGISQSVYHVLENLCADIVVLCQLLCINLV
jgi:hypothetical protein